MSANTYIIGTLSFPWKADRRNKDLSSTELKKGYRTIGGDKGDVQFDGYDVDENGTELSGVVLLSTRTLSSEDAIEVAIEVVTESYDSIGTETVEHS